MKFEKQDSGLFMPFKVKGSYQGTLIREGRVIDEWEADNIVTNEGLNTLLGVFLNNLSQISTWYLGIFSNNYTPVSTDTAASLPGNTGENTAFTATSRAQWQPAAPASQSINNSANRASYTFNASSTIYGAFLVSSSVLNGTSGVSFSAAQFPSPKIVANLDQMLLSYTFSAASA